MDPNESFEDEILAINPGFDLIFNKMGERRLNQDETESNEEETIVLMRRLGLEQSIDGALDESRTVSTVPVSDDVIFMQNGPKKMVIFMSNTYFEFKPRMPPDDTPFEGSTKSEFSADANMYRPILLDSTTETEVITISESNSLEREQKYVTVHTNFDLGVSSDSCKCPPAEEYPELSSRRRSAQIGINHEKKPNRRSNNNLEKNWWPHTTRDEHNWRKGLTKVKDTEKRNEQASQEITQKMKPNRKKKTTMIRQVFAENQRYPRYK